MGENGNSPHSFRQHNAQRPGLEMRTGLPEREFRFSLVLDDDRTDGIYALSSYGEAKVKSEMNPAVRECGFATVPRRAMEGNPSEERHPEPSAAAFWVTDGLATFQQRHFITSLKGICSTMSGVQGPPLPARGYGTDKSGISNSSCQ